MSGTWFDMGQLTPSPQWQLWPYTTDRELFRITHYWRKNSWFRPRGIITQFWGDDEIKPGIRILAKEISEDLLELKIPDAYKQSGDTQRTIGVLMFTPYTAITPEYEWHLGLEVFDPGSPPVLDGGEY